MKEARLAEVHRTLELALSIFEVEGFQTPAEYEKAIATTLWKLGYPDSVNVMGPDDAEEFLMEYFEDFNGRRPTPYKMWETTLH